MAHTEAAVTDTSAIAVPENPDRQYLLLINDSDTTVYLKFGAAAVENEGIRLNAAGGAYEVSSAYQNRDTSAVHAVHGGDGEKTLLITEYP